MKDKNKRLEEGKVIFFAEFPLCFAENSAHAGSVILDWILSLDSGFIDDNSALNVLFCYLSTLLQSNPTPRYVIPCGIQDSLTLYNDWWALTSY